MRNASLQQLVVSFNSVKNCKLVEPKHIGHDVNDTVCTSDVSLLNFSQNVSILNVDIWSKKWICYKPRKAILKIEMEKP